MLPSTRKAGGVAHALVDGLVRRGYRRAAPPALTPSRRDGALFITPSAPAWQKHLLSAVARGGGGAVTLSWRFDTSRLDAVPAVEPPTAQRVVGAVHVGHRPLADSLHDLLGTLEDSGVSRLALTARTTSSPPAVDDAESLHGALAAVGIRASAVTDATPRGTPRRMRPELGPSFVLESPVGSACSAHCGPGCPCGRYLRLGYGQFLRPGPDPSGRRPTFEAVLLEYMIGCVSAGVRSPFDLPALRALPDGIRADFPELSTRIRGAQAVEVIADHLCTVALLLGVGVAPGPRGRSYVVRKLVRRAASEVVLAGARPEALVPVLRLADAVIRTPLGLAPLPAPLVESAGREIAAFKAGLTGSRRWFLRRATGTPTPEDLTRLIWRARRERGVPIGVLLAWCEEHALPVSLHRLAAHDPGQW
ncbi:alanine--tRNA ligase-related protein [Kitasatospora sp. KL5]|uniref:alanine--tRNA ligase-related protein n=1 Tax=Kitasatospora sp. KL5 TaxID=3425125 RepID=UPI003D6EDF20